MDGCLKYRQHMIDEIGYCPFTVASTIAGYTQYVLRAKFITASDFPYLPEGECTSPALINNESILQLDSAVFVSLLSLSSLSNGWRQQILIWSTETAHTEKRYESLRSLEGVRLWEGRALFMTVHLKENLLQAFMIAGRRFSVDCFDPVKNISYEILGNLFSL